MTYLKKMLTETEHIALSVCEIIIPVSVVTNVPERSLTEAISAIYLDYEFLKEFLGGDVFNDTMLIEDARQIATSIRREVKTREVKRAFTTQRRREYVSKRPQLVLALIERDDYICAMPDCECQENLTVDHVVPLSRGGSDDLENLQFLCAKHNSIKRDTI